MKYVLWILCINCFTLRVKTWYNSLLCSLEVFFFFSVVKRKKVEEYSKKEEEKGKVRGVCRGEGGNIIIASPLLTGSTEKKEKRSNYILTMYIQREPMIKTLLLITIFIIKQNT